MEKVTCTNRKMICPGCLSENVSMTGTILYCRTCIVTVDMASARFCKKVPMFNPVSEPTGHLEGTLHRDAFEKYWQLLGYAPGCGRVVSGDYCTACRSFLPQPTERPTRKGRAVARTADA